MRKPKLSVSLTPLEEKRDSFFGKLAKGLAILATLLLIIAILLALTNTPYKGLGQAYVTGYFIFVFLYAFTAFQRWMETPSGVTTIGWIVALLLFFSFVVVVGGTCVGIVTGLLSLIFVIFKKLRARALKNVREGE